ncbi:MAG: sulfatase-like hydrolase/transferase, partial [Verrucomicrobiota bacterium]|nr:sulfatase-like hydrolase/transferase [Verrucomicrobiota bacterium]
MKQNFIIALILGLFTISGEAKIKPNILFIMVDDLGKDWISCYGADDISTPHIDRLANGGLKFHN